MTKKIIDTSEINIVSPQGYEYRAEDEIDLLKYWDLLWCNRRLITFITFFITILAIVVAFLMTPIYKSEILLTPSSIENKKGMSLGRLGGLASLMGGSASLGGASIDETLVVLKSRVFLKGFFVDESIMPLLFEKQWDIDNGKWLNDDPKSQPTFLKGYKRFSKSVMSVNVDSDTGMVLLAISWKDPVLAQKWVTMLVDRINAHMRKLAIAEASTSVNYLKKQISSTNVLEMQQMLYGLIEEETKKIMLANVREQYVFKVIDPAVVPEEKIKPKRALIAVLGIILGFFFAIFFVFFREFIRKAKQERSLN